MITKIYQITCEKGCTADYIEANKDDAEQHFKDVGWIFEKGKHFCSQECRNNYFAENK